MQPYFDPTRKTTSKKNGRRPQKKFKKKWRRPQKKKKKNEDNLQKNEKMKKTSTKNEKTNKDYLQKKYTVRTALTDKGSLTSHSSVFIFHIVLNFFKIIVFVGHHILGIFYFAFPLQIVMVEHAYRIRSSWVQISMVGYNPNTIYKIGMSCPIHRYRVSQISIQN